MLTTRGAVPVGPPVLLTTGTAVVEGSWRPEAAMLEGSRRLLTSGEAVRAGEDRYTLTTGETVMLLTREMNNSISGANERLTTRASVLKGPGRLLTTGKTVVEGTGRYLTTWVAVLDVS